MKLRRRRRVKAFPQKRSQLGGCGLLPENGVWGHAPPSAFGRAAASPQTRQMRCWPSAAQATYHSFPPLPPTKTRSLRCTAFIPPKPLRWVSAGALLGEVIRLPFCIFGISVWGWYHYPWRVLHAVETLGAQGTRWLNKLLVVYSLPVGSASAHSGSRGETRGVLTA